MRLNKIIQRDYTSFSLYYQIKLPLDLEISIPSDDPVRLVSAFVEEMDLSELYKTYGRIRKNQATPRQMLKLVIYAAMNRIYSSRDIRKACKRDINFMYLLEGMPAPDHATIARFISLHFSACAKVLKGWGRNHNRFRPPFGHKAGLPPSKKYLLLRQPLFLWKATL